MVECRAIFGEVMGSINHAQRKLIRVGAAEMGVSTLGGSGGMLPRENFEINPLQNAYFAHSLRELMKK